MAVTLVRLTTSHSEHRIFFSALIDEPVPAILVVDKVKLSRTHTKLSAQRENCIMMKKESRKLNSKTRSYRIKEFIVGTSKPNNMPS